MLKLNKVIHTPLGILASTGLWFAAAINLSANSIPLTGNVNVGNGSLTATADWNVSATMLSWVITPTAGGWNYSYEWTGPRKELSHIILEVTPPPPGQSWDQTDFWGFNPSVTVDSPKWFTPEWVNTQGVGQSRVETTITMPDIYGFKWEVGIGTNPFSFSFFSSHAPTLGDFIAIDGSTVSGGGQNQTKVKIVGFNAGYSVEPVGDNLQGFRIVVPNGRHDPVPDAGSTLALMGLVAMGLCVVRRQMKD